MWSCHFGSAAAETKDSLLKLIDDGSKLDELGGILLQLGAVVFRTNHPARGGKKEPPQALAELTLNESR
jgi:hypothetical protein